MSHMADGGAAPPCCLSGCRMSMTIHIERSNEASNSDLWDSLHVWRSVHYVQTEFITFLHFQSERNPSSSPA